MHDSSDSTLSPTKKFSRHGRIHFSQFCKNFSGMKRSVQAIPGGLPGNRKVRGGLKRAARTPRQNQGYSRVCRVESLRFCSFSCVLMLSSFSSTRDSIVPRTRLYYRRGNAVILVLAIVSTIVVIVIARWLGRRTRAAACARFPPLDCLRAQFPSQFRLRTPTGIIFLSIFFFFSGVNPCLLTAARYSTPIDDLTSLRDKKRQSVFFLKLFKQLILNSEI